jgi:hypothetical protein
MKNENFVASNQIVQLYNLLGHLLSTNPLYLEKSFSLKFY